MKWEARLRESQRSLASINIQQNFRSSSDTEMIQAVFEPKLCIVWQRQFDCLTTQKRPDLVGATCKMTPAKASHVTMRYHARRLKNRMCLGAEAHRLEPACLISDCPVQHGKSGPINKQYIACKECSTLLVFCAPLNLPKRMFYYWIPISHRCRQCYKYPTIATLAHSTITCTATSLPVYVTSMEAK